jgi:uncharacterized protein
MRWRRRSEHVDDRRRPRWRVLLSALLVAIGATAAARAVIGDDPEAETVAFVSSIFADVQDWAATRSPGYRPATLVLYRDSIRTRCGAGVAQMGPFYCPADQHVYLDMSFFWRLDRLGGPGDFAQAYVIAHEVGHHIQDRSRGGVALELEADCLAGAWARSAQERGLVEPGDVAEAIAAAMAVGDDQLQRAAGRAVNPETWTHGSSDQRVSAWRGGLDGGDCR